MFMALGLCAAWILFLAACLTAWGRLRTRLGLDGADPADASSRELVVRRALRRLLAFNCWVIWPFGLPLAVMLPFVLEKDGTLTLVSFKPLFGALAFTVALPMLVRQLRRFERERAALTGLPVPRSFWIEWL